jgi:hypothetical protein
LGRVVEDFDPEQRNYRHGDIDVAVLGYLQWTMK